MGSKFKWIIGATSIIPLYYYFSDSRASFYKGLAMPFLHLLDPEKSHKLSIWLAKNGLVPRDTQKDDSCLQTELFGMTLSNPIGLAAGYDKDAEAIDALFGFGFGAVEVGSITPQPQPGNPLPRMFRLPLDEAVINRYGFNSAGHDKVLNNFLDRVYKFVHSHPETSYPCTNSKGIYEFKLPKQIPKSLIKNKLLGINLGKNKASLEDSHDDYVQGIKTLGPFGDYLVVNVSSPNTPGLRSLQRREPMLNLMQQVKDARDLLQHKPPLLVKIAPDLSEEEIQDIASVITQVGIDGVIISNTTISRPSSLASDAALTLEKGGLSGPPVKPLAIKAIQTFYKATQGQVPIIGCGGVRNWQDVIDYARAGASFVQLYTALGYQGPGIVGDIKVKVSDYLIKHGLVWKDLIGSSVASY